MILPETTPIRVGVESCNVKCSIQILDLGFEVGDIDLGFKGMKVV